MSGSKTSSNSAHTAFRELPRVSVAALYGADASERLRAAHELGRACRDAGFFYLVGHRVSDELIQRLLERTRAFFALPAERKWELYIGKSPNHRGYVPPGEEVFYGGARDQKESFDLCFEAPEREGAAGNPFAGPNVWPELPGFRETVSEYYQAIFELGLTLFRGFALAFGLPETFFERFVSAPPSQLRLLHYPNSPEAAAAAIGIGAHTDYECFTILLPTAPGLEVMNGAGEWIDAPPLPGAFVVNIGDMLETFTNGELTATSHRVRKLDYERYSFPLFFACDYDVEVAPLPPFVSAARPARYPTLIAGEHLYAQTVQSFRYFKERLARGEVSLPPGARPLSSFGQEGKALHPGPGEDEVSR